MSEEKLSKTQFVQDGNEERPETCQKCGAPVVWCTCYQSASLGDLLDQLESCGFRCEAGPLENHLAFIELRRWAENEKNSGYTFFVDATINRVNQKE